MTAATGRVLVVEDRLENQQAAQVFFESIGLEVEFASTLQDGVAKLEGPVDFYAGVFDMELPRVPGSEPENCGVELEPIAKRLRLPCMWFTGGVGGHSDSSYVATDPIRPDFFEKSGPMKNEPNAWRNAWRILVADLDLDVNYASRVRYRSATGHAPS